VGHLVGDVAGDHESGVAQDERFVGQAGKGHAEAVAGEVELRARDGGGIPLEFGGPDLEAVFLAGAGHEGVGEEFAPDGGGEARIAFDGGVEAHVATTSEAKLEAGNVAGAPELQDIGEAALRGEFGPGEGASPGQDVRNGLHAGQYGPCAVE
jgi:hypothetical protein